MLIAIHLGTQNRYILQNKCVILWIEFQKIYLGIDNILSSELRLFGAITK